MSITITLDDAEIDVLVEGLHRLCRMDEPDPNRHDVIRVMGRLLVAQRDAGRMWS